MKKVLLILTIVTGVILVLYGVSLIVDYMVTTKYHVEGEIKEQIIYTTEERVKEITLLKRYFYYSVAFGLLATISSLIAIFTKS